MSAAQRQRRLLMHQFVIRAALTVLPMFLVASAGSAESTFDYQSAELGFALAVPANSAMVQPVTDERLQAFARAVGPKPPVPVTLDLLIIEHGKSSISGAPMLAFSCTAFIGAPGAEQQLRLVRSAARMGSTGPATYSDVTPANVGGLAGYRLRYQVQGITGTFVAFDRAPWTVVCGGNSDERTKPSFDSILASMRAHP